MNSRLLPTRIPNIAVVSVAVAMICVVGLSLPTDAGTSDLATVPVTCKVVAALEASFPGAVSLGNLNVGAPPVLSAPQTVTVRSNAPWALKICSDAQDGRMRQWTGTGYATPAPRTMAAPLEWKRQDGADFAPISGNEAVVAAGMPPTGSAGATVSVVFRQAASYDDEALPDPAHAYRIEVTYVATQTY
ncbi:MAG: hypothetical protein AB1563_07910 [Bacillota bacterium]